MELSWTTRAVADDANLGGPPDDSARDHATRDRAEPRDLEESTDFGLAEDLLGLDRREHADESLLDVLGELVDDAIRADVDALAFGELSGFSARTDVEADDDAVRRRREVDVVLRDPPHARVDHIDPNLGVLDLLELPEQRLHRALHVALQDDVELLHLADLHLVVERLERDEPPRSLRELLAAQPLGAHVREVLRLPLVLDDATELTCRRGFVEPEDLHRIARQSLTDALAPIVVERSHLARGVARDNRVADTHRSAEYEHCRDRPSADVETRFDDEPRGIRSGIGAQIELGVGHQEDPFEQVVEIRLELRGDLRELGRPAPILRLETFGCELVLHAVRVRIRDVDLVDGDDDRHLGGACMGDRLLRLRHDAVIGGDDQHGDVRHLRASCSHRGERLVAGGVEERDPAARDLRLVCPYVLGDSTGFGLDDGRLANRIEKGRLPVVDVAHDRDDRRTREEILVRVVEVLWLQLFLRCVLDGDLALELGADRPRPPRRTATASRSASGRGP